MSQTEEDRTQAQNPEDKVKYYQEKENVFT